MGAFKILHQFQGPLRQTVYTARVSLALGGDSALAWEDNGDRWRLILFHSHIYTKDLNVTEGSYNAYLESDQSAGIAIPLCLRYYYATNDSQGGYTPNNLQGNLPGENLTLTDNKTNACVVGNSNVVKILVPPEMRLVVATTGASMGAAQMNIQYIESHLESELIKLI